MQKKKNRDYTNAYIYRHGDIIYVTYVEPTLEQQQETNVSVTASPIKQDEVDDFLEKQRGLIDRKKDLKL
jgi:nuclear protein localization family protein 4